MQAVPIFSPSEEVITRTWREEFLCCYYRKGLQPSVEDTESEGQSINVVFLSLSLHQSTSMANPIRKQKARDPINIVHIHQPPKVNSRVGERKKGSMEGQVKDIRRGLI